MRVPLALLLALVLPLAGCATPGASVAPAAGDTEAAPEAPWSLADEGTLGWVAAAGAHVYAADLIVGVRSHDQCPEVSFVVPAGASALRVAVARGVGPATVSLSGPAAVTYVTEPVETPTFDVDSPDAGVWTVELKPMGVLAQETRALLVEVHGNASAPPAALRLQPDADCLL